jgi:hydroxypyruvate reductase
MIENRAALERTDRAAVALDCVVAGIEAAHPRTVVRDAVSYTDGDLVVGGTTWDRTDYERVLVVGGGNAAGEIALALEGVCGDAITDGVVVTDAPTDTDRIECRRGDHPLPSERNVAGADALLEAVADADAETLVIAIVAGGGSALLASPAEGISLADLEATTRGLLESGASINEINAVRKHLSAIKGGQLARTAAPADVLGLVFSDVVGNDLAVIASGPTAPDPSTFEAAIEVLDRYDVDAPESVRTRLQAGDAGSISETPGSDDPVFQRVSNHVLADNDTALRAAAETAEQRGLTPLILSARVRGEAREAAKTHAAIAEECLATGSPVDPPAVLLSGGETTVTIRGDGTGGPNQEFALSGALETVDAGHSITIASVDTDGIDGATDAAGALVDGTTVDDSAAAGAALDDNDAYPYLDARDALITTGQTGTNVNDLRVIVVED